MSLHQGRFTIGISAWEEEEENQGRSILEISRFYSFSSPAKIPLIFLFQARLGSGSGLLILKPQKWVY